MKLSLKSITCVLCGGGYVATAVAQSAAVDTSLTNIQCNDTDALLKVSYTIDKEGWDSLNRGTKERENNPKLNLKGRGVSVEYKSFDDVKDFEMCVPQDGCSELTINLFPTDAYDITLDGEKRDVDFEFEIAPSRGYFYGVYGPESLTEIGDNCNLICDETNDEALFEYRLWSDDYLGQYTYSVVGERGDEILGCSRDIEDMTSEELLAYVDGGCSKPAGFSLHTRRACLPRNSCYQFVTEARDYNTFWSRNYKQVFLSYDGKLLEKIDGYSFKSIQFGNCESECNESMVELLVKTDLRPENESYNKSFACELTPDIMGPTWEVSVDGVDVSSGSIPYCSNTSLFREVVCLPRDSCGRFYITNSNETRGDIRYSLKMDNVTYRSKSEYTFRSEWAWKNGWNETSTNIGRCTVDGLCDASSQALFEVDLLTPAEYVSGNGESLPVIPIDTCYFQWVFGNSTYDDNRYWGVSPEPLLRSDDYVGSSYELGSVYRTVECVPNDQCVFDYTMTADVIEKYEVRRNGMALSRVLVEYEGVCTSSNGAKEVTAFSENCNTLSGGAIAGIVIGSLAAVGIAVYAILDQKKKANAVTEAEDTTNIPVTDEAEAGVTVGTERMTENSGDGTTP